MSDIKLRNKLIVNFLLGFLFGIVLVGIVGTMVIRKQDIYIIALEEINQGIHNRAVDTTIHSMLDEPGYLFESFNWAPKWEEIEAVPYSVCYRHIVNDTESDYIMCKAI